MELFSCILSQLVHCGCIERLLIFFLLFIYAYNVWAISPPFFCKFILYPSLLLKLFIVSRSFGVEFFAF
jgi:hypothetical protein